MAYLELAPSLSTTSSCTVCRPWVKVRVKVGPTPRWVGGLLPVPTYQMREAMLPSRSRDSASGTELVTKVTVMGYVSVRIGLGGVSGLGSLMQPPGLGLG